MTRKVTYNKRNRNIEKIVFKLSYILARSFKPKKNCILLGDFLAQGLLLVCNMRELRLILFNLKFYLKSPQTFRSNVFWKKISLTILY